VIFNITVNLAVIPAYGFVGAAAVTIASEIFEGLAFYYYVHRHVGRLPWLRLLWRPWLGAGLMVLAMWALWSLSPVVGLLTGLVVYGVVIVALGAFNAEERATLASILPGSVRQRLRSPS
jgi:O-antigen/teichoic acid export membrane protein